MKKIPLTQGKFAIVDDEDYERINQWKWCACNFRGYWYAVSDQRKSLGAQLKMHRVVLGLNHKDKRQVDHVNHNGFDNRRCNLRICSRSQNQANRKLQSNNKSGYKGVSWHRQHKRWEANIMVDQKQKFLGRFDNIKDAALAYDAAAERFFGKFATTNERLVGAI